MCIKIRDLIILQMGCRYKYHTTIKMVSRCRSTPQSHDVAMAIKEFRCRHNLGMTGCKKRHAKVFSTASQLLRFGIGKVKGKGKGKGVPLQARRGPEGSRKLRFPDFVTTAQDGGKVVSLTHRPPLPQEIFLVLISVRG